MEECKRGEPAESSSKGAPTGAISRTLSILHKLLISNLDGITGFSEEGSQSILGFMKCAVELAKSGGGLVVNAAVIFYPSVKQVIASGCHQICSCYGSTKESNVENCSKQAEEYNFHPDSDGSASHMTLHSNGSSHETKRSYAGGSCLNPLLWAQQKRHKSSCNWHHLRLDAVVAIESPAARDRCLYPDLGHGGDKSHGVNNTQSSSTCTSAKRQKTDLANVENGEEVDVNFPFCISQILSMYWL